MARRLLKAVLIAVVYVTVLAVAGLVGGEETAQSARRWMRQAEQRKGGEQ